MPPDNDNPADLNTELNDDLVSRRLRAVDAVVDAEPDLPTVERRAGRRRRRRSTMTSVAAVALVGIAVGVGFIIGRSNNDESIAMIPGPTSPPESLAAPSTSSTQTTTTVPTTTSRASTTIAVSTVAPSTVTAPTTVTAQTPATVSPATVTPTTITPPTEQTGSEGNTAPAPQPTVVAEWGPSAQGQPGCTVPACKYLIGVGTGFEPGSTVLASCWDNGSGGWQQFGADHRLVASNSGEVLYQSCYFGFPGAQAQIRMNGIVSNTLTS